MKWFNRHFITILSIWWVLQGITLLGSGISFSLDLEDLSYTLLGIGCSLIIIAFLLLIKHRVLRSVLSILLFLYSIYTIFFMGLLFLFEQVNNMFGCIMICFVIPDLNFLLSLKLLMSTQKKT